MICSLDALLNSIPKERFSTDIGLEVERIYRREVDHINYFSSLAEKPDAHLFPFYPEGNSLIATFWVNDLSIPRSDKHNWHGQNVSQWKYAGCILISEDNSVSSHH